MFVQPHGIELLHWWSEVGWILKTIRDYRVSLFVEIGVFHGALARIIMDQCVDNIDFNYVGIEHDRDHVDQKAIDYCRGLHEFNDGEAEFMFCDALAPAAVSEVRSRILSTGVPAMVYCDGGDKISEARLYWPHLRPGDIMGIHDFGRYGHPGIEVFPDDVQFVIDGGERIEIPELDARILMVVKR